MNLLIAIYNDYFSIELLSLGINYFATFFDQL
jgi:hypothetical protein